MNKYIGSQQHWEDNINADYDERERQEGEQVDNRTQPDPREQPKGIIYWFYYVLAKAKRSF
ncbi:hypothetical protein LCGC14_1858900 [marine sediment metagenome]|uniref:Uncharacterized protein n=1 Tax=marine sediment metagenome TaxID=412755 RepID=A0A0F9J769_9ZZZZ